MRARLSAPPPSRSLDVTSSEDCGPGASGDDPSGSGSASATPPPSDASDFDGDGERCDTEDEEPAPDTAEEEAEATEAKGAAPRAQAPALRRPHPPPPPADAASLAACGPGGSCVAHAPVPAAPPPACGADSVMGLLPALPGRRCGCCGAQSTPLWRNGPEGPKTLCNACGVRDNRRRGRMTGGSHGRKPGGGGGASAASHGGVKKKGKSGAGRARGGGGGGGSKGFKSRSGASGGAPSRASRPSGRGAYQIRGAAAAAAAAAAVRLPLRMCYAPAPPAPAPPSSDGSASPDPSDALRPLPAAEAVAIPIPFCGEVEDYAALYAPRFAFPPNGSLITTPVGADRLWGVATAAPLYEADEADVAWLGALNAQHQQHQQATQQPQATALTLRQFERCVDLFEVASWEGAALVDATAAARLAAALSPAASAAPSGEGGEPHVSAPSAAAVAAAHAYWLSRRDAPPPPPAAPAPPAAACDACVGDAPSADAHARAPSAPGLLGSRFALPPASLRAAPEAAPPAVARGHCFMFDAAAVARQKAASAAAASAAAAAASAACAAAAASPSHVCAPRAAAVSALAASAAAAAAEAALDRACGFLPGPYDGALRRGASGASAVGSPHGVSSSGRVRARERSRARPTPRPLLPSGCDGSGGGYGGDSPRPPRPKAPKRPRPADAPPLPPVAHGRVLVVTATGVDALCALAPPPCIALPPPPQPLAAFSTFWSADAGGGDDGDLLLCGGGAHRGAVDDDAPFTLGSEHTAFATSPPLPPLSLPPPAPAACVVPRGAVFSSHIAVSLWCAPHDVFRAAKRPRSSAPARTLRAALLAQGPPRPRAVWGPGFATPALCPLPAQQPGAHAAPHSGAVLKVEHVAPTAAPPPALPAVGDTLGLGGAILVARCGSVSASAAAVSAAVAAAVAAAAPPPSSPPPRFERAGDHCNLGGAQHRLSVGVRA